MNLRRWILVYLATGPSFTRWAVLAFYGGGLVVVVLVVLTALALIGGNVMDMRICTARASGISRESVKSGCAREWGGWGRLSEDGPGQHNPDRSEGPWGRAADPLARRCLEAHHP